MTEIGEEPAKTRAALEHILEPLLGEFATRILIKMASHRIGKTPETIDHGDMAALAVAMRPALRTLVGVPATETILARIAVLGA